MNQRLLLIASAVLLVAAGVAWWLQTRTPEPVALTPTLTGETEYCLTCHADVVEISPSHPVETFGCVICHGGERLALDANLAHSSMRGRANPSDLAVVERSCGGENCHNGVAHDERDHIQRVMTSIQVNYTGAITSILFTFGAWPNRTPTFGAITVTDTSLPSQTGILHLDQFDPNAWDNPSVQAFSEKCLTCHIEAIPADGEQYQRYSGCAACHTPTQGMESVIHKLTTAISYTQCNTCHNRGNYDMRAMTFVERTDDSVLRIDNYYQPIAQFTQCEYTLDCVDCHTRTEVMGDGDIHATKADIQYIQCKTCHGTPTELPLTKTLTDLDDIAFRLVFLDPVVNLEPGDTILVTEQGEPLWNTRPLPDDTYEMVGKATRQYFTFRPVLSSNCTQSGDDQSSAYCHTCHAVER